MCIEDLIVKHPCKYLEQLFIALKPPTINAQIERDTIMKRVSFDEKSLLYNAKSLLYKVTRSEFKRIQFYNPFFKFLLNKHNAIAARFEKGCGGRITKQ